jgi:hypothetical protein
MLGLCGAHRTGKTTLAAAVSSSVSDVFKRLGYDPQADYDYETTMQIQEAIMEGAALQYRAVGRSFIADRTPVDMMAYTLARVQRSPLPEGGDDRLLAYLGRGYEVLNQHFSVLVAVQPGIKLLHDPTKAPASAGYVEHINSLILGLMVDARNRASRHFIQRNVVDLNKRVSAVVGALDLVHARYVQNDGHHVRH